MEKIDLKNKLIFKVSLPLVLTVLFSFMFLIFISRNYLIKSNEDLTNDVVLGKIVDLEKNIQKLSDQAIYASGICAGLPFIEEAYSSYNSSKNIDLSAAILKENLEPILKSIQDNTGLMAQIHYHLSPARSLLRSWTNKKGDDLTSFRHSIVGMANDKKPLKGIEVGVGGFVIRGISPIFVDKEFTGTVEVMLDMDTYLKTSKNNEEEEIAMFMKKDLITYATKYQNETNILEIGEYINIDKTSDKFIFENITSSDLMEAEKGSFLLKKNSYKYGLYPIKDVTGNLIGIGVFQLDMNSFYTALTAMNTTIAIIGIVALVIVLLIIMVLLTRYVLQPIQKAMLFVEAVSKGDLTKNITSKTKDEVGMLISHMKNMQTQLTDIVSNILNGSKNIADASNQMSSTSQQLSQGATEQASSAEEVSSSMEEMSANIQQNTDNARQTEQIIVSATEGIREGRDATKMAVTAMKNIAEKINIINDIAFQTNILALNAAVEAARAGEHGKGFAVVAAEVRKLAERSKVAAEEIDRLSKNGVEISENAGKQLAEIVPEIERTAKLVQEIAAASIEQNAGTDQINTAIQQFNQTTQSNAAASEEMAASSEELASQAEQLKELISFFKTDQLVDSKNYSQNKTNSYKKLKLTESNRAVVKLDLDTSRDNDFTTF